MTDKKQQEKQQDGKISTVRADKEGIKRTRDDLLVNPEATDDSSLEDLDEDLP